MNIQVCVKDLHELSPNPLISSILYGNIFLIDELVFLNMPINFACG